MGRRVYRVAILGLSASGMASGSYGTGYTGDSISSDDSDGGGGD